MTLNPGAEEFRPSTETLQLVHKSLQAPQHGSQGEYPPPILAPFYINTAATIVPATQYSTPPITPDVPNTTTLDYENFDLPYFFHDMMAADADDFGNYLPYRAEYLLGYANTSTGKASEVINEVLTYVASTRHSNKECRRALLLASEMADMDSDFLQQLLQKLNQDILCQLTRFRSNGRRNVSFSFDQKLNTTLCITLARVLRELHVGTCVNVPVQVHQFAVNACLFLTELLKNRSTMDIAICSVEMCYAQIRSMSPCCLDSLHIAIQRCCLSQATDDLQKKLLIDLIRKSQRNQIFPEVCNKPQHYIPIAQLNDEENEDFEQFLIESQRNTNLKALV